MDELHRSKFIEENLPLVWSLVHRFKGAHFNKQDLFQIGCLGLVKAVDKFDASYNVQFSTYAVPIILGEIRRFFRDDGIIKVSRGTKELNIKINKQREKLNHELNREPTLEELAIALDISVEEIAYAMEANLYPTSISEPVYEQNGGNLLLIDTIIQEETTDIVNITTLKEGIATLSKDEQLIIELRFFRNLNQEEIAKRFGVSQVQISRLEKKIIAKLRKQFI